MSQCQNCGNKNDKINCKYCPLYYGKEERKC